MCDLIPFLSPGGHSDRIPHRLPGSAQRTETKSIRTGARLSVNSPNSRRGKKKKKEVSNRRFRPPTDPGDARRASSGAAVRSHINGPTDCGALTAEAYNTVR